MKKHQSGNSFVSMALRNALETWLRWDILGCLLFAEGGGSVSSCDRATLLSGFRVFLQTCAIHILKNAGSFFPYIHCIEGAPTLPQYAAVDVSTGHISRSVDIFYSKRRFSEDMKFVLFFSVRKKSQHRIRSHQALCQQFYKEGKRIWTPNGVENRSAEPTTHLRAVDYSE